MDKKYLNKKINSLLFCFLLILTVPLYSRQIVLDNFDDGNSLTLYGKGEIGLTTDKDEVPAGHTILSKVFDLHNDHTTGSGYSLKLENYVIDLYGGVYLNVTGDPVSSPYIDGSVYRQLSFYLKASTSTTDWHLEIKDWDDKKVNLALGVLPQTWLRYELDLTGSSNICNHINITNIKSLVFINKVNNSAGSLWLDDFVFDDLVNVQTTLVGEDVRVSFSDYKINENSLFIRITVRLAQEGKIEIDFYDKNNHKVSSIKTGDTVYVKDQDHSFEWYGKDDSGNGLRNGVYFVKVKTVSSSRTSKTIKPIGIFR